MAGKARILVVDDEPNIRFFLEETLTNEGYEVFAVDSGEKALSVLDHQQFDLALIDLKLKGMSGIDLLKVLAEEAPEMSVIVLTAYASLETAIEALRQGAHDYLFKPTKTLELRESVRQGLIKRQRLARQRQLITRLEQSLTDNLSQLRSAFTGDEETDRDGLELPPLASSVEPDEAEQRFLQYGPLWVDLMRHVVTLDDTLLELSPTEFSLLAYLVSEAPRVVSPQSLVREVQGYESEPWEASETIRYHVYRIRQKIKAATGQTNVIRTVRGVGYTVAD